ncbi:hypothetical protein KKF34_04430 [Myxococcota bacterium]|nr:hypothetical protein [Myxococcota bacterium]MBU1380146.1 hypothetical protein [Myxococcota bacterium]MBU1496105.1 hypothetical protein [Myxococcota bacterium]
MAHILEINPDDLENDELLLEIFKNSCHSVKINIPNLQKLLALVEICQQSNINVYGFDKKKVKIAAVDLILKLKSPES